MDIELFKGDILFISFIGILKKTTKQNDIIIEITSFVGFFKELSYQEAHIPEKAEIREEARRETRE